ncbi:MAG TPA: class I SAM-dependent methyltransferase [Candidatus Acidoferrum sp.]|nr:class I SAM-dependent methyltransferase [Candidatus Acidoferrum sp.]
MSHKTRVRGHFDRVAPEYDGWKRRAWYYYRSLARILGGEVPAGARVLDVGCGTGTLLDAVRPAYGMGVDFSPAMVKLAEGRFPGLRFRVADAEALEPGEAFDWIMMVDVLEHLWDPRSALASARRACHPESRLIVMTANPAWQSILHLAERLRLKMPEGDHRWMPADDIRRLLHETGFEVIREDRRILLPKWVPAVSWFVNERLARVGVLRRWCLVLVFVARPRVPSDTPRTS